MSRAKTAFRDFRDTEEHRFTSDLIHNQVPSYYVEDGPLFIKMIQEFYNYAHKGGNFESAAKNMIKLNDVDEVAEYYEQYLLDNGGQYTSANTTWTTAGSTFIGQVEDLWRKQYLLNFPTKTASFHIFLKQVINIYRAKGSANGFKALMLGIYGIDVEVRDPWEQTFKPSDGAWEFEQYIQVAYSKEVDKWVGRFVYGTSSGAQARVEEVIVKNVKGKLIAQLLLTDISDVNEFIHNETIFTKEDEDFAIKCIAGIKGIELSSNGSEFVLGEETNLIGNGIEGKVIINSVDTFNGRLSFTLSNDGLGYRANSIVTLVGGIGGAGAAFKVGGIKEPFRLEDINQDIVGGFMTNNQISIGDTVYYSNSSTTSANAYLYNPIAGPNSSNGLNASWNLNSTDAKLDADVANNTFANGSQWMLGNTSPNNAGHFKTMEVADYFPGNSTIRFTSTIPAKASTNTAIIRQAGANSIFNFNANLSSAGVSTALNAALVVVQQKLGAIDFIITTSTGGGYITAPQALIRDTEVFRLRIPDGAGSFLGADAVVDVRLLANNVITNLKVADHGIGYDNTTTIQLKSQFAKGTSATGKLLMGGVARSSGGWVETRGMPDTDQRIHDSDRYQAFSYNIVGQEVLATYKKTLTSIAHTAGTKMFGTFQTFGTANTTLGNHTEIQVTNERGGVTIANNTSTVVGFGTTYGGSSNISVGDIVTTNGLRFKVQSITSNTNITGNSFIGVGISNSSVHNTPAMSANVKSLGTVTVTSGTKSVTGTDTNFNNQIRSGYGLAAGGTLLGVVDTIQSNTTLQLKVNASSNVNTSNMQIVVPNQTILKGNIALPLNSRIITGTLTNFVNEVKRGDILVTSTNVRLGTVNSVPTSTQIRLANNYTGTALTTARGIRVLSNRSFLGNFELSGETSVGDGGYNLTGQFTQFQNELANGDKLFLSSNNLFIGTINKVTSNTSANLITTFTSPNSTDLSDALIIRRHKLSQVIVDNGNNM
jgi:hypothetical protein